MTPSELTVDSGDAAAQSALHITRAAIARWTGGTPPRASLRRDAVRLSPQARYIAQARRDLAAWMAHGGFAQDSDAGAQRTGAGCQVNACME